MSRKFSSRRMTFIGAVLVVGLTACGAPTDSPAGQAGSTPTGAPPVIQVDGAAPSGAAVPAAEDAAMSDGDAKMMPSVIAYVYDGELTDLTAAAPSWFFEPGVQPSTEQIAALAAALGIDGEVRALGADAGGGWMVGPDNYEQPTVTVSSDAMHSWWYSPGNASMTGSRGCELYPPGDPAADLDVPVANDSDAAGEVAPVPPDGSTETVADMPVCVEAAPPANVPDQASAQSMARTLFESVGMNPDSFEYETYADDWSANVTGYLVLDGMRTSVTVSVGYGAEGAVTWASGYLATPQRGADYPRIGIEAAVQRLNDQTWGWMASSGGAVRDLGVPVGAGSSGSTGQGVASAGEAEAAGSTQAESADSTAPSPAGEAAPAVEPSAAPEPMPEPLIDPATGVCADGVAIECGPTPPVNAEPIKVTLTAVRPSLEQLWASDGTVWLLPAYTFDAADGGLYSVLAVEDQYIEVSQGTEVPAPDTAPLVDPGVDSASPAICPALPTAITEPGLSAEGIAGTIVGLCEADASALVTEIYPSATVRVVRIDGVDQAVTADFSDNRVNVAIDKGIVTEVISIG